jgi:membrane protein implicated in regulation of membrane protease activity
LSETAGVNDIGKTLVILGLLIALAGLILVFVGRVPWSGRLPGDIYVQRGNWSFYFPIATSIVLSLVLTLLFWLFGRR